MDANLIDVLVGFGPVGLAAGAIFWTFIKTSKRLDDLTDSFQAQLREQAQGHIDRESALRDRYDQVISTYNDERLEVIKGISNRLDVMEKELVDVEGNLKLILEILNEER